MTTVNEENKPTDPVDHDLVGRIVIEVYTTHPSGQELIGLSVDVSGSLSTADAIGYMELAKLQHRDAKSTLDMTVHQEQTPVPVPETPSAPRPRTPADFLDLGQDWELVTPYEDPSTGKLLRVQPDKLATYTDPGWRVDAAGFVTVGVPVNGRTTPNSRYPRHYLREWWQGKKADWSTTDGHHTLVVETAVMHVPSVKPQLVLAEVHDPTDDVLQVMYDGLMDNSIVVRYRGKLHTVLIRNAQDQRLRIYLIGYDRQITARVETLNGAPAHAETVVDHDDRGLFFQTGLYLQTNVQKGDEATDAAFTALYSVRHHHTED